MAKGKLSRKSRKLRRNGAFSAYVTNKWDGIEPYEEFMKREFKVWNNLPSSFKRINIIKQ
jgi:hypothetical protein